MIPMRWQRWSASSMLWVVRTTVCPSACRSAKDLPQSDPALRVEPGGGLVQEQDGGAVQDRPRDHQPLGKPARQRHHRRLRPLGQPKAVEQVVGCGALPGRRSCRRSGRESTGSPRPSAPGRACSSAAPHRSAAWRPRGDGRRRCRPTNACPEVGITRVVSMLAVVVLPAPFGPSRPKISPSRTVRLRPSTAVTPPG